MLTFNRFKTTPANSRWTWTDIVQLHPRRAVKRLQFIVVLHDAVNCPRNYSFVQLGGTCCDADVVSRLKSCRADCLSVRQYDQQRHIN